LTVRSAAIEGTIFYDRNTGRLTEGAPSTEGIIFLDNGRLIGLIGRDGEAIMPSVPDDGVVRWPEAAVEFMESLLRAPHVAFAFEPAVRWRGGPSARDRSIGSVVGRRVRVEQWSKVEKVIPSLDVRPTLVPQTSGDVTLDREDWRLLRTINGRRTVSALAQTTHMSPAGTCERLMNLFRRGLVELNLTAPGTSADEIVGAYQQVPTTESTAGSPKPVVVIVDESFEPNPGQQAMPPEPVPSGSSRRRHHPWVRHRKHM
jgi:hypothetical protein